MYIRHFFNELRQMVFYELSEKEVNHIQPKAKIIPFYRYNNDTDQQSAIFYFDAEYFVLNKTFKILNKLDPYGSTEYEVDGKSITLLNTYGEEDNAFEYYSESKNASVFVICIIYDNTIEVADVVNSKIILPRKKIELRNHMFAKIPEELQNIRFSGKRAFYFYRDKKMLSLRVSQDTYNNLPEELKHKDAEEWVSGPRCLIRLSPISEINT